MQYCIQKLLIKRERIFINNFVKAGVWSTNLTGVSGTPSTNQFKQWSASGSTPVKDVDSWCNTIEGLTGEWPNVLAIAPDVLSALKSNSDIISRISTHRGHHHHRHPGGAIRYRESCGP
jgi:predicted NAD/FAD-binding protein